MFHVASFFIGSWRADAKRYRLELRVLQPSDDVLVTSLEKAKNWMALIETQKHGAVLVATMNRGKANALNAALVDELLALIEDVGRDESVRVLLLGSASDKVFCAGFDVEEVFGFDRPTMHGFVGRFVDVIEGLRALPKVVVVAISGHAYAGGALLALGGDLRLMADTRLHFSIPEADLGVDMPLELTGWLAPIPHGVVREMLLGAIPLSPRRALEVGFVCRVAPSERLLAEALDLAQHLADKAPLASAGIKAGLNAMAGGVMSATQRAEFVDKFVASWFGGESVARRQRLAASLGKPM